MKIGSSNPDGLRIDGKPVVAERAPTARGPASSEPVVAAAPVDRVSLTGSGSTLAGNAQELPFDGAKVDEIRRAIAEGRFPVDAKRIADALLAESRERMGLPPER